MRATIHKVERKNYLWILALVLFIVPIVIEIFLGDILYNASHQSILNAQTFMYETLKLKAFDNSENKIQEQPTPTNKTENSISFIKSILSYLAESSEGEGSDTSDIFITEFIHLINSNAFYLLIVAFLYNFINVYKIFILYMTIFLANFLSSTLSYIFQYPKPYMAYYKIKSVAFFNEWASPNNQIVLLISFGFSFYKVVVANKLCQKKLWIKILIIVLLVFYNFIDGFLLFSSGNVTYNQIINSSLLGVVIFVFIFYCFPLDLNKSSQFYDFMKFNKYYWITINILILVFQILLSGFITDRRDTQYYDSNLKEQARRLTQNDFTKNYCKYRTLFSLNNGNFCNVLTFLMNVVAFLSIKAEIKFIYNNSYNSWSQGNFENPKIDAGLVDGDNSGLMEYNNLEQSQWNHNHWRIVLLRTILDVIFNAVIFIFFIWVTHFSENEIVLFIFLITFPMILCIFGNLFFFKALYIKMNLAKKPKIKMRNLLY